MPVIFINRFFHPDLSATSQILSDLAFGLAEQGREIRVIASRLRYEAESDGEADLPARETVAGVTVHRVRTSRFGRGRLVGRAVDYLTFYVSAAWCLWRLARAGDVVVAKTDPPMLSVVAAPICRLRGAHLVNWLQDLFPEIAQASGIGGRQRAAYALLSRLRTLSLRAAAANVVIGETMGARIAALGLSRQAIRLIPNWTDRERVRPIAHADNPFRQELGLGAAFLVVYSGNLGRVHDIATMLDAMSILSRAQDDHPPIRWLFVGGGALTATLRAEVAQRGLGAVAFLPYQPSAILSQSLSAADAHIASLRPEFEGLVVPSKVGGAMAVGRPILFVGDRKGEIGRLIARFDCGHAVAIGDGDGLADAIRALARDPERCAAMGRRARQAFEAEFDRAAALERWATLLDEVARRGRRAA